jgi:lysophospholipase L1-like esterase
MSLRSPTIVVTLITAGALLGVAFLARGMWIRSKFVALSSMSPPVYAQANTELPPKGRKMRLIFIGDSRIASWPTATFDDRWEVVNRGIAGETAAQLKQRFAADALALKPDSLVIEAGINDLVAASFLDGASKSAIARKTTEILLQLVSSAVSSGIHPYLATIIPPARPDFWRLAVWKESARDLVAEVNTELRRAKLPNCATLIDVSSLLDGSEDRILPEQYRLDTLHINEAAYDRLTASLRSALEATHPLPTPAQPSWRENCPLC